MFKEICVKTLEKLYVQTEEIASRLNVPVLGEVCEVQFRGIKINPYAYDAVGNPLFTREQTDVMLSQDRNHTEAWLVQVDGKLEVWDFKIKYIPKKFLKLPVMYDSSSAIKKV